MRKTKKKVRTKSGLVQLPTLCIVRGCVQRADHNGLCAGCFTYLTIGHIHEPLGWHSQARRLAVEEMLIVLTRQLRTLMLDEA
jgi:hypothetical protein